MRKWQLPDDKIIQQGFWQFWKTNKLSMMGKGFSVYKNKKGKWELQEWHDAVGEFKDMASKPDIVLTSSLDPSPLKDESGLREWQIPAAASLAESIRVHGSAIDGSDTGTGKTYAACAAARELGMKIGVICPKAVIESWTRVIRDHFKLEASFVLNYESLRTAKHKDILVKKRKNKSSLIEDFHWTCPKDTLLIFDESHRLKGRDTLNAKMAKAAKNQKYKVLCASATNAVNPLELDAVGKILGLHNGGRDYYRFIRENGCTKGYYAWEFDGSKYVMKKLHKEIFLDRGTRLRKDDIPNFPESEILAEPYSLGDKSSVDVNKIYSTMNKELSALETKVGKDKKGIALTIRLRARQKIELLKAPLFIEMAEDLLADGNSIVVLCNFNDTIKAIAKKLNTNCIIWGANTDEERTKNMDDFQADKERVILVNVQAGGVGLSLHDLNGNHPRVALISPNDSAVLLRQALGRVHRDGAKTKSMQRILFAANTVEEDVCDNVKRKLTNLDRINDGDLDPKHEGVLRE
jgi:superfamily II DNA or RNA helicase